MAEKPENIQKQGDSSAEIRPVLRMPEGGELSPQIATSTGDGELASDEFVFVLYIHDFDSD